MSVLKELERFCYSAKKLHDELKSSAEAKDYVLIQRKLAEIDELLQYYSSLNINGLDPQIAVVSDCLSDLETLIEAFVSLFIVEQSEISNQLANIKISKRISAVYQQSNSNEP